ncbi:MgtC/SapB family protein [Fulvimarina sp. 2208YS6-2-32]|uniref:Protein MgtC n=1 Tax=Fulvimarina uroteuthidis TaxID=3098149 RepID=A0ABU5HYH1_9HYPH|nr:MgtC/SapB family protein [Fulvimarina sp. 2208YS6-2-32]MDY8108180.1 MgtC/SapB family protein [Fulvimarina sp. 2208YS6-2-32]
MYEAWNVITAAIPGWPLAERTLQLSLAAIFAGVVGYEREAREQSAGLRTHMMVGIGACLFTILMISLVDRFDDGGSGVRSDPIRIVSAITSGIAFLAAGAIIQSRGEVKGLTTGASLWVAGALGLACGLAEYALAIVSVAMTLLILRVVKKLE